MVGLSNEVVSSRSARRFLAVVLMFTPLLGSASRPDFGGGGFTFSLQYGPGYWAFSPAELAQKAPGNTADVEMFVGDLRTTHVFSLKAQYAILGHLSVGGELTGTVWGLSSPVGGALFGDGLLTWHPLELVFALLRRPRPIPLDLGTSFGVGYGLAGQRRGMDGLLFEWALDVDYFFSRYFAVGAFVRGLFFAWDKLYLNYLDRAQPGNTIALASRSGGAFWTFGVNLSFRAGD